MRSYMTVQGDMWDGIAYKVYGKEKYINILLQANSKYGDIVVFPAGIVLICPEVTNDKPSKLPPWKRGQ